PPPARPRAPRGRHPGRPAERPHPSSTAPPPVMHEIVDDLAELADGAALADEITGRSVERHHAVTDAPAPLSFGIQPNDTFHALAHHPERPRLGVVVVVPSIAEDEDRRAAVQRV